MRSMMIFGFFFAFSLRCSSDGTITMRVSVVLLLGLLAIWPSTAGFLNHRPFPTYSLEDMPDTQFTCREKILGGYYADPDAQCQMFHICVKVAGVGVQDFRFLCPNGTAFDQDHQICAEWEDVDCDATTLYYSSDNFDLYRVGSGFESKAHKYGEDEETFALQRAETGDVRLNRERETQVVNQQQQYQRPAPRRNNFNNNEQERDIFKGSSSSNFFNNRNNGKETDEDYDDNVNANQNRDFEQKRKLVRKQQVQQRRPVTTTTTTQPTTTEAQTRRPQRPTGFTNNFAGSSYNPTTQGPQFYSSPTIPKASSFRIRGPRQRVTSEAPSTPVYTVSTPAPFSVKNTQTENYPSNNPQYSKLTTPFDKKPPSSPKKFELKPTTFSPSAKPFSFPTTFAPRTQDAYSQVVQQTSYNTPKVSTTLKPTSNTQYTPTVPKISSTTPSGRSSRYDETQYDDGSYDSKYDYDGNKDDEFLKTAHSQNIASSRNELAKAQKQSSTTYDPPTTQNYPRVTASQRANPTTQNYPRVTSTQKVYEAPSTQSQRSVQTTQKSQSEAHKAPQSKKVKDVSYDYAYYDSFGVEPDYHIDTEVQKTAKN